MRKGSAQGLGFGSSHYEFTTVNTVLKNMHSEVSYVVMLLFLLLPLLLLVLQRRHLWLLLLWFLRSLNMCVC